MTRTDADARGRTNPTGDRGPAGPVGTVVVGGGQVGRLLARRLADGRGVHFVDDDRTAVERAGRRHRATHVPDVTDRRTLERVVAGAARVVVATGRDATNLLVVQHCRRLEIPVVLVVVADPRNHDAYPPGVVRVCAAAAVVDAVFGQVSAGAG